MSTTVHGIIRIDMQADWSSATARARCACGAWRQAGAYGDYPGRAGASLLVLSRFDCQPGTPLEDRRVRNPFPASPESIERAADDIDRQVARLRQEAERLTRLAEEYEAGCARLRSDLAALSATGSG